MLISYTDAAALLGMTPGALRAAVSRGDVPHIRLGDRTVRFDRDELFAWIRSRRVPARGDCGAIASIMDAGRAGGRE